MGLSEVCEGLMENEVDSLAGWEKPEQGLDLLQLSKSSALGSRGPSASSFSHRASCEFQEVKAFGSWNTEGHGDI